MIRREVLRFTDAMESILQKNDYKGGWQDCDIQYLQARLVEELGEYFASVAVGAFRGDHAKKELIDIANFCLFIWDRS